MASFWNVSVAVLEALNSSLHKWPAFYTYLHPQTGKVHLWDLGNGNFSVFLFFSNFLHNSVLTGDFRAFWWSHLVASKAGESPYGKWPSMSKCLSHNKSSIIILITFCNSCLTSIHNHMVVLLILYYNCLLTSQKHSTKLLVFWGQRLWWVCIHSPRICKWMGWLNEARIN